MNSSRSSPAANHYGVDYIWAFDVLVVAPEMEKPQASARDIRLLDIREIQIWIAEGPNTRLNLVGVR
jgi:hypothetical protein